MVTLTINRKPQDIFSKPQAVPLQDKTNTTHKMNDKQRSADKNIKGG